MPFIRHHISVFNQLCSDWHWHIVEGVAELVNDTAWSLQSGGYISNENKINALSNDGTTEYIDEIKKLYPDRITVYRKSNGQLWNGKCEMVQVPLENIKENCLLWQVDVDEFWSSDQIHKVRDAFISNQEKTAAWYWCNFYVGPDIIVCSRNCYSQNHL